MAQIKPWTFFGTLNLFVFAIGIAIEWIQGSGSRAPEWHDIWRNHVGLGLAWFSLGPRNDHKQLGLVVSLAFLAIELGLIFNVFKTHQSIQNQLPIISDFESPSEAQRWKGDTVLSRENPSQGDFCLQIHLDTGKYSGTGISSLPHDWTGYAQLSLWLYNPEPDTIKVVFRIHDKHHNQEFFDRFNAKIAIRMGWNPVVFSLQEIEKAPRTRPMDMKEIRHIGLFTMDLESPKTIKLDNVRLLR